MFCSPTLTEQEFKILHNSLWDLSRIDNPKVQEIVERIRTEALKGAYAQDNAAFERKHEHYSSVRDQYKLMAVWSLYEVEDLEAYHPYPSDVFIQYGKKHWPVEGLKWKDMFIAADKAIQSFGDSHHIFIEKFVPIESPGALTLQLVTGS